MRDDLVTLIVEMLKAAADGETEIGDSGDYIDSVENPLSGVVNINTDDGRSFTLLVAENGLSV